MILPDLSGQQFGKYRLIRCLGSGGFASVYLGQHSLLTSQQAAIKILHLHGVDAQRFQREADTTARLTHPHIVRLHDFDFQNGTPYLVLDYAPQGSLATCHPHGQKVPLATVISYLTQIVHALQYAHDQHVIHRDLKPDNILIGRQGELLLSDFGIAVLSQTGRTSMGSAYGTVGTAYYMAPEQFRGKPEKASDQYSLAVIVYEWLCGEYPFPEGDFIQLGYQHSFEPVPSLRQHEPNLPVPVEEVILKALSKQPQDRYASVQAFAAALEQATQSQVAPTVLPQYNVPTVLVKPVADFGGVRSRQGGQPVRQPAIQDWEVIHTLTGHIYCVTSVAWSLDGRTLASSSWDKTIRLWDARSGQLRTLTGHTGCVYSIAWSPDGQTLASGSQDGTIKIWGEKRAP